jgi:hypothetical protein
MSIQLTPEQEAKIPEYITKYMAMSTNTAKITDEEAEEGVKALYELLELPMPEIVKMPSIKAAWDEVVERCVPPDEKDRDIIVKELKDEPVWPRSEGSFDAGYFAYCDFLIQELNIELPDIYHLYRKTAPLHLMWPLDDVCILSERFNTCEVRGTQLHCESGPAIAYDDGLKMWYINDLEVDEKVVMRPHEQTRDEIEKEQNADIKAIRIERYGWLNYLGLIKAELIDETPNDVEGTWEALYKTPSDGHRFVATDPAGPIQVMGVPSNIQTCIEARTWLVPEGKKINIIGRT